MTEPRDVHLDDYIRGKVTAEFDRLEEYLKWPSWNSIEAQLILAGIDIENAPVGGPYRFLPGGSEHLWGPNTRVTDWSLVELRLRQELEIYSRLDHRALGKPLDWLKASLEADCEPRWARLLVSDGREEFRQAISLIAQYPESGTPPPVRASESQPVANHLTREGGNLKFRRSRAGRAFYEVVKKWDMRKPENHLLFCLEMEQLYEKPKGEHLSEAQKLKLTDGSPIATRETIKGWIKDLARKTPEKPFRQAEKVRKREYSPD